MNGTIQRLRAEIRFDREALARRVEELRNLKLSARDPAGRAQAAVALHHAYGSVEALMERIAREIDGSLPAGSDWHRALLHAMGLDVEAVRPALFSRASVRTLQEILGFRHFFRHAYAVELDVARLQELSRRLCRSAPDILAEIDAFDGFLAQMAEQARAEQARDKG